VKTFMAFPLAAAFLLFGGLGALAQVPAEPFNWRFVDKDTRQTLYTWGADPPGVSTCDVDCPGLFVPFTPEPGAMPAGTWTFVPSQDGDADVWACNDQATYIYVHEGPEDTKGVLEHDWYVLFAQGSGPDAPLSCLFRGRARDHAPS